jgi:P-type conjugative transfer protein TrbJ
MRPLSKLLIAVPLACGVHVGCVSPAHAQISVFDPANYSQNLLTAARALQQITNQVRQLQNQVLMLQRMDQNLMRLGSSISPDLQRTLGAIQTQLNAGEGMALRLQATQSGYDQLFPRQVASTPRPRHRRGSPPTLQNLRRRGLCLHRQSISTVRRE